MAGKTYQSTSDTWHQRTPARRADIASDVTVPLLQSLVTGLIIGALALLLKGWRTALLAWLLAFGIAWLLLLADHRRLLWSIESITNTDLDRDGNIGRGGVAPPSPEPGWITIDGQRARQAAALTEAQKKREAILRFIKIIWLRQRLGRATGQKALRGHDLPHGYAITDEFHSQVGDKLIAAGLARRNGKGWDLTAELEDIKQAIGIW